MTPRPDSPPPGRNATAREVDTGFDRCQPAVATWLPRRFLGRPSSLEPQVLILAFARMAEAVGNSFLIVVLPLFIASDVVGGAVFGLAEVTITGVVLAIFGLVNSSLQPITGRLSDRTGRRRLFVLAGLLLLSAAGLAYSFATEYWQLLGLRVVQGISGALIVPTSIALVNDYSTDGDRGENMGIFNAFRLLGFGIGPIGAGAVLVLGPYSLAVGRFAIDVTRFEAAFAFAAATALLGFLLVLGAICEPRSDRGTRGSDTTADGENRGWIDPVDPVVILGVVSFLVAVGIAMYATLGDLINVRLDQNAQMFGVQFAAFVIANIVLLVPIGRATDRYGRKPFLLAGTILMVPTTAAQGFILDPWVMLGMRFAQGAAAALVFTPALALAGDLARRGRSATTLSVITMAFGFGIAVGPLLSGLLAVRGFHVPFVVGGALAAVGTVLVSAFVDDVVEPARTD